MEIFIKKYVSKCALHEIVVSVLKKKIKPINRKRKFKWWEVDGILTRVVRVDLIDNERFD